MSTLSNESSHGPFKTTPTILQVIPALKSGGVEVEALEIGKAIAAAGARSLIAANLGKTPLTDLPEGIEFKNLPLDSKNPFRIANNTCLLKELILKEKVDIVHARSRRPGWCAYKAARSLGIPFITTYHAAYSSSTLFKTFYNSIMARGDRVIAISQFIQNHLLKKYGKCSWFDPSKIRLIPRGIDLDYFNPKMISDARLQNLRESWGIPPDGPILLLPGRITRTKGQDILVNAIPLMQHKNVRVVLVGSAQGHESYRDNLLRYAASLNLQDQVKWVPPCSDMPAAYHLADIIVCPSLSPEGFGRVMAEAQAMKKPIIAANHGAAGEIVRDGITGWLIPPSNVKALAQVLDAALTLSQKELSEMGKKGRDHIKTLFSKDRMFSQTLSVYQELLQKGK